MMRFTINTPEILKVLQKHQANLPYSERSKPFNFGLMAITQHMGGSDPVTPIAPFTDDLSRGLKRRWVNTYDGKTCRLALPGESLPGAVQVQTYGLLVGLYRWHPEAKSLAPDGTPCAELTVGLLGRTPVTAGDFGSIGKEADRRWEREEDMSVIEPHRLEYRLNETARLVADSELQHRISGLSIKALTRAARVSKNTVKAAQRGQRLRKSTADKLASALNPRK